jgi:hypothetical protein
MMESRTLAALRVALLPKLLSGGFRVRAAPLASSTFDRSICQDNRADIFVDT